MNELFLLYLRKLPPYGTSPHLNYKHSKWWTFYCKMLVSVTGSVLQILVFRVSFNNNVFILLGASPFTQKGQLTFPGFLKIRQTSDVKGEFKICPPFFDKWSVSMIDRNIHDKTTKMSSINYLSLLLSDRAVSGAQVKDLGHKYEKTILINLKKN